MRCAWVHHVTTTTSTITQHRLILQVTERRLQVLVQLVEVGADLGLTVLHGVLEKQ